MIAKINLAPEVYQASLRNKQRKKVASTLGIIISLVAVSLVGVALVASGGQKVYLATTNSSIKKLHAKLDSISDLQTAVTTQQHLDSIVDLFKNRTYMSQFFRNVEKISPVGVALESVQIDPTNNVTITAESGNYNLATKFAKALQADNTEIGLNPGLGKTPYFTDINIASAEAGPTGKVNFKVSAVMAPEVVAAPEVSENGASNAQ